MPRTFRPAASLLALLLFFLSFRSAAAEEGATAWLGLGIEKGKTGVRVTQVLPQSPCATADIHPGDEVLSVSGTAVADPVQLIKAVRAAGVGATAALEVLSPQGKSRRLSVVLGPKPDMDQLQRSVLLGKQAPDFTPKVLSGKPMGALSSLQGDVVLLDFFASWCGPCMRALPEISALHRRLSPRGLRVVGVSNESADIIRHVIDEHALPYTVTMDADGQAARGYQVFALPTLVVIDRKGQVRHVALADLDSAVQEIETALAEPLGKNISKGAARRANNPSMPTPKWTPHPAPHGEGEGGLWRDPPNAGAPPQGPGKAPGRQPVRPEVQDQPPSGMRGPDSQAP